ncbi:MAG: DUF1385 domain-containing protein [Acidobacteria bacterium]|nr:DUF1385 domain-containing protein [Acidobacteriota bacterium]
MTHLKVRLCQLWKMAIHLQLMPVLESGDDPLIGGQAVIEGVMMRAPHSYCTAVRKPNGEVVTQEQTISRPSENRKFWGWFGVRGLATLGQAMKLGFKALQFSAAHAIDEDEEAAKNESKGESGEKKSTEIPGWMMALNIAFSLGFFIFLYKFVPLVAATQIQERTGWFEGNFGFSLLDGVIRLAIFLTFLTLVSRMKDIRRVFQYHGAEHKVVFNYESGKPVEVANAQAFQTFHPRCGTSFLMVVMIVSIAVYAFIPFEGFALRFLSRIVMLPFIAGLSYEVIRFASRRGNRVMGWLVAPGLWLQRITTKNPSDEQVEISIRALKGAMDLEQEQGGELIVA